MVMRKKPRYKKVAAKVGNCTGKMSKARANILQRYRNRL